MKISFTKERLNKYYLSILFLSFLSILPLVFSMLNISELLRMQKPTVSNKAFIETLSKTIMDKFVFAPFLMGLVV